MGQSLSCYRDPEQLEPESPTQKQKLRSKRTLSNTEFNYIRMLGQGTFGKVYLVEHIKTSKQYAIKVINKKLVVSQKQIDQSLNERNILARTNHPFIIKLKYAFQDPSHLFFVMEYIKGADLHTHCLNQYFRDEYFATFYVAQIVLALEHLHTMGIIYRDLKPQNVLVQLDGHIKLIDFGLSKTIKKNQKAYSFCGTAAYMSPEILLNEPYDFTSDWYSLGIVIYFLLTKELPFGPDEINRLLVQQNYTLQVPMQDYFSENTQDILKKLLNQNPKQRLGFRGIKEIKNHPFFADINWGLMYQKQLKPPGQVILLDDSTLVSLLLFFLRLESKNTRQN